ncbi:MAG: acetate--CoA ligase family protein [Candidatus Dojkabacteria bacterium]|nr:acetate--CoA ligase family protein [Candidatus Dojkabacteria bacterium]
MPTTAPTLTSHPALTTDIHPGLLAPSSVAVIGASEDPNKIGSQVLRNIINAGYGGAVYPINPHARQIQGLPVFKRVSDIPGQVDHAVFAIPAIAIPDVLTECAHKDIHGATIISAGFRESGADGKGLEERIISIADEHDIHIIGPNCLGFINTNVNLNATFSAAHAKKGNIVLFSQSGAFGTAILDWADQVNLGFRYFVSIGNKAVLDETDFLAMWLEEFENNNENIIFAGYVEDIRRGRLFMKYASLLSKKHPVVILKPGKQEKAQMAISSHTGSIATDDAIVETALAQSGCIRVDGIQKLFDCIQVLSRQSIPSGNKTVIITNAGGPGVVATDLVSESSLELAELSETTRYTLSNKLPPAASVRNPIDIMGDAKADRYEIALEAALCDENVDSAIVLLTPQAVTEVEKTAAIITEKYHKYPFKPVVASFIGGKTTEKGIAILNQYQMPIYTYPRQAISSLSAAYWYRASLDHPPFDPGPVTIPNSKPTEEHRKNIVGAEAEAFLSLAGFHLPRCRYVKPDEQVTDDDISYVQFPMAIKLISKNLLHKTELSAVKLGITSKDELVSAVSTLTAIWEEQHPGSLDYCIQLQQFIPDGEHVILGAENDPSFGPVVLFGSGGIYTELYNDSAQCIAPFDIEQAHEMIKRTKTHAILDGYRGQPQRDIPSVADALVKISSFMLDHPEIIEFDINPFIVLNKGEGGLAADIKIITRD